jgi:hypothetical protein
MAASLVLIMAAGTAVAATQVGFELGVGGSNAGSRCPAGGAYYFFDATNEVTDDTATFPVGSTVTWSLYIDVSGFHTVNSVNYNTPGAANIVFDVALHDGATTAGPLVGTANYHSTVMDGNGGCALASASFAYGMNGWNAGPARIIDKLQGPPHGGPNMNVYLYPTNPGDGTLLGMGAGYASWDRSSYTTQSTAGVGRTSAPCDPNAAIGCLGRGPIAEGQISGLAVGTYTLEVIPGAGINVLRGDKNLGVQQDSFAIAADNTAPDTITFQIIDAACTITKWASIRDHDNTVGTSLQEVGLDPIATGTEVRSESRRNGLTAPGGPNPSGIKMIVIDFDKDVTSSYVPGVTVVDANNGANTYNPSSEYLQNGGTQLVLEFMTTVPGDLDVDDSTLPDEVCYVIDLASNVTCLQGDTDCMVRALTGDVAGSVSGFGNGSTNTTDSAAIRAEFLAGTIVAGDDARYDVTANGQINQTDASYVRDISFSGGLGVTCP